MHRSVKTSAQLDAMAWARRFELTIVIIFHQQQLVGAYYWIVGVFCKERFSVASTSPSWLVQVHQRTILFGLC